MDTGRIKNLAIIKGLAWLSWIFAAIGGCALIGTFGGSIITAIIGWFPDAVAPIVFGLGALWMVFDGLLDFEPNRPAIWLAILLPSVGQAVNGTWGMKINQWGDDLNRSMSAQLGEALGTGSLFVVAALGIGGALILARRVVKKNKAMKSAGQPAAMAGSR